MKLGLVIFIALTSVACNKHNPDNARIIDESALDHVLEFEHLSGLYIDNIHVRVIDKVSDNPNVIGTCGFVNNLPTVSLKASFWLSASYYSRELLVFHELGHCVYGLAHNPNPRRVMYWQHAGNDYEHNRDLFLSTFFQ